MAKKIIAVNASPRRNWNTSLLVSEAAQGAQAAGAEAEVVDLYRLEAFKGCVSCFGCKLPPNEKTCVLKDGLAETLAKLREADGIILGSPIYLGELTAGFRALYERFIFPFITYRREGMGREGAGVPVLLVVTSNCPEEAYEQTGYDAMIARYKRTLENCVGPTEVLISADTLQVNDYSRFNWTMFDPEAKRKRREEVFPLELKKAWELGKAMAGK